jgi:hypothetical protein
MNQKRTSKAKRNDRIDFDPTEMEKYRGYVLKEIKKKNFLEIESSNIEVLPNNFKDFNIDDTDNIKDVEERIRVLENRNKEIQDRIKENERRAKGRIEELDKKVIPIIKWGFQEYRTYKVLGSKHQDLKDSCLKGSELFIGYHKLIINFQGKTDLTVPKDVVSSKNVNLREIWIRLTREKTEMEKIFPDQKFNENYFHFSILIIDDESVVNRKTGFSNKPIEIDFYIEKNKDVYPQLCEQIYNRNLPLKATKEFMELFNFLINFIHFIGCAERWEPLPFERELLFDLIQIY